MRGAHQYVNVTNCHAKDPKGRQKSGKVFGFSSKVTKKTIDFQIDSLFVFNCTVKYSQRGSVFLQGVNYASVNNIVSSHAGGCENNDCVVKNPNNSASQRNMPRPLNIFKVDDLGINSRAVFKNCSTVNTIKNSRIIPVSFAKEDGNSITNNLKLINCSFDTRCRIRSKGGGHEINGGEYNGLITVSSSNVSLKKLVFKKEKSILITPKVKEDIIENILIEQCHFQGESRILLKDRKSTSSKLKTQGIRGVIVKDCTHEANSLIKKENIVTIAEGEGNRAYNVELINVNKKKN